jgi:hypothetical protein
VHRARDLRGIVPGERKAQRFRGRVGEARAEQALDRAPACRKRSFQRLALLADARGLPARGLALGLERRERAVRLRNGALGFAQRIARFLARCFLFLEPCGERFDAAPQRGEVLVASGSLRDERGEEKKEEKKPQAFALPCPATAAMRRATSSGSPR